MVRRGLWMRRHLVSADISFRCSKRVYEMATSLRRRFYKKAVRRRCPRAAARSKFTPGTNPRPAHVRSLSARQHE
ncbi:unnamed protein product, partial [Iphiclides podalirius]